MQAVTGASPRRAPLTPVKSHGQTEQGNIDLYNRPKVPNPKAGGTSTVYSASFNMDGKEVLLPLADGGRILTDADAVDKYRRTGQHLGKFDTVADAKAAAKTIHDDYERGRYDLRPATSRKR